MAPPRVLIISSFVAASRVGGYAQSLALAARGVEAHLAPTVLFGRSPGLGPPGGGAVAEPLFSGVLGGAEAAGGFDCDAVLTGYFSSASQTRAAAAAIGRTRTAGAAPLLFVDPILGDEEEGLYVNAEVEDAVRRELLPRADIVSPNLFELGRLTGRAPADPAETLAAARTLGRPVLATSVPCGAGRIGVLYVDGDAAVLAAHEKIPRAAKGTGDFLKALFLAERLKGRDPATSLAACMQEVVAAVLTADAAGACDLPLLPGLRAAPADVVTTLLS